MHAVNRRLATMLDEAGAPLAGIYSCPHRPEEGCDCRKPRPALLHEAGVALGFAPAQAIVIGDKSSDVELGQRAGATTIRISAGSAAGDDQAATPDYTARDLIDAARIIAHLGNADRARGAVQRGT
jgi:D-glycero-D-manno-heptose 1,7-bisphosphate phosphatase